MGNCIDAEHSVKGAVVESQSFIAVRDGEIGQVRQAPRCSLGCRVGDTGCLDIEAGKPTANTLN
jgi:hypothetical protein